MKLKANDLVVNKKLHTAFNKKELYILTKFNLKGAGFFFRNKKSFLLKQTSLHYSYRNKSWHKLCKRIVGLNKNLLNYMIPYMGYNKHILYTNVDEFFFLCLKLILKRYSDYFTISWFLIYIKQRTYLLPLYKRGIRYYKKLPSRGQRTRSNYSISKRKNKKYNYNLFKKRLTKRYISQNFPSWNSINSFYFYRF